MGHVRHADGFFHADFALGGLDGLCRRLGGGAVFGPPFRTPAGARHVVIILMPASGQVHLALEVHSAALVALFLALAFAIGSCGSACRREHAASRASSLALVTAAISLILVTAGALSAAVAVVPPFAPAVRRRGGGVTVSGGGHGGRIRPGNDPDLGRRHVRRATLAPVMTRRTAVVFFFVARSTDGAVAVGDRRQEARRGGSFGHGRGRGLHLAGGARVVFA